MFAAEMEAIEIANDGGGNLVGAEEFICGGEDLLARDGFDGGEDFVLRKEAAEVHFRARKIGHARAGGFERQNHRALQIILCATQFFAAHRIVFEVSQLFGDEGEDLLGGFE